MIFDIIKIMNENLVLEKIIKAKKDNKLSHAYLITGPKNSGKFDLALSLAKNFFCEDEACGKCQACISIDKMSNPDLSIVDPEGEIKISDVKEIQKLIYLKPYLWSKKVIIIKDAHRLNEEASNSILKILEEPPSSSILILTSSGYLLETIKSRCQQLKIPYLNFFESDIDDDIFLSGGVKKSQIIIDKDKYNSNVNLFKKVIKDNIGERFILAADISSNNLNDFFECIEIFLRKELYKKINLEEAETTYSAMEILNIIDKMQKTKEYIGVNVNSKFALENFFLNL